MNNTGRTFTFIILSSMILMTAVFLQNYFFPQVPADIAQQQANAAAEAEKTSDPNAPLVAAETPDKSAAENSDETAGVIPESTVEPKNVANSEAAPELTADDSTPKTEIPVAAVDSQPKSKSPSKLVTLGSMDPASGYRFLTTYTSEGGALRRLELNAQNRKGRIKYRDLETKGGYLGNFDCIDTESGVRIRAVGDGTPAANAGLKVGDLVKSIDGEFVASAADFKSLMEKTKPGQQVLVTVNRDSADQEDFTANVTLTDTPIELIRPEPGILDPDFDFPESFLLTLRNYVSDGNWPELDARMRTGNWDVKEFNDSGVPKVEFSFVISNDLLQAEPLKQYQLQGPLRVVKRYWLEKLTPEEITDLDSRSWHIKLEIEIENQSPIAMELGYQLDGPIGTPTEGWWYQMKIHGRSTAFGSMAGARDVIASSEAIPFIFYSAPDIVKNAKKTIPRKEYLFSPFETPEYQKVNYFGVDNQYFDVVMMPEGEYSVFSGIPWHTGAKLPKASKEYRLVDVTTQIFKNINLEPGQKYMQTVEVFCGPKEPGLLAAYGLGDTRTFGWFGFVSKPLCWLLHVLYYMTFQLSYGISIVLLTVLVRSLMIPFSRKANLNTQMMQHLQPQIKAIADKYKDDMEKRAQAQRELFKKHQYNPFGGCLMMFVQLPIFLGLYRGLSVDIALRDQPLIPGLRWCSNLAAPDQLLNWSSWMPGFLGSETGWLGPYLNILPIATMFLFIAQQKLFMPPAVDDQQKMMQKMMKYMMIFMGVLFFKVPSGLCIYFITSSVWGILERKFLPKPVLDTDKLELAGSEIEAKPKVVKEAPVVVSNKKEIESRKQRDKERKRRLKERGV